MKTKFFLLPIILFFQYGLNAQENNIKNGIGVGYQILQYQNDFGMGVNIVSPYFLYERMGVRLKANIMFNESIIDNETEWIPYSNVSLGMIGVGGKIAERIRLYGEGGILFLLPAEKISTEDVVIGGYGLFGFEFFFSNNGNYFIEIGGVGTGATAELIENKPIYSNGMTISVGLRFFL